MCPNRVRTKRPRDTGKLRSYIDGMIRSGMEKHHVPGAVFAFVMGGLLRDHMPDRMIPPGVVTSNSNYGAGLAGYIIESVSGQGFNEYARDHIFVPPGTTDSDFMPRPDLIKRLAKPYLFRDGKYEVLPCDHLHFYPTGSLLTTASDIARFMIAHLQGGRWWTGIMRRPMRLPSAQRKRRPTRRGSRGTTVPGSVMQIAGVHFRTICSSYKIDFDDAESFVQLYYDRPSSWRTWPSIKRNFPGVSMPGDAKHIFLMNIRILSVDI
jgi:CubicO group peptidase (beta-lactamase class C family)